MTLVHISGFARPGHRRVATGALLCCAMAILMVTLAGCAGVSRPAWLRADAPKDITIDYDPANATAANADNEALDQCGAYGKTAHFIDETMSPSARLRHRHYECR